MCLQRLILCTMTQDMIKIRKAELADHAAIVAHNQAMAWETEERQLPQETVEAGVMAVLKDPNKGFYLVAEREGEVIGNLMITYEWSDWRNGWMWWFQSVYVKDAFRGKKVFAQLYAATMQMAQSAEAKELRLYVEKTNLCAQAVYKALGMEASHYDMWEVVV